MNELIDWVVHARPTVPTRRSSLWRVRQAIDAWHLQTTQFDSADYPPETLLAPAPIAMRQIPNFSVTPLVTIADLAAENTSQRHCVAIHASAAVAGELHIYREVTERGPVTVALRPNGESWRIVEAVGFANRRLEAVELQRLEEWRAALPTRG